MIFNALLGQWTLETTMDFTVSVMSVYRSARSLDSEVVVVVGVYRVQDRQLCQRRSPVWRDLWPINEPATVEITVHHAARRYFASLPAAYQQQQHCFSDSLLTLALYKLISYLLTYFLNMTWYGIGNVLNVSVFLREFRSPCYGT